MCLSPVKLNIPVFRFFLGMNYFLAPQHPTELLKSIAAAITLQMLRSNW